MAGHTLVITNDYPPRKGGIQTFIFELVSRFPADQVTVLTSQSESSEEFDRRHPWTVVRRDVSVLLPTRKTRKLAIQLIQNLNITTVIFGAGAPLGLLAPALRAAGVQTIIAMTHGHEAGWAATPLTRHALRHIARHCDYLTYLGEYTRSKISPALHEVDRSKLRQLTPGVDTQRFSPDLKRSAHVLREKLSLGNRPVIVCVSRLMPRKGQDVLIKALPSIKKVFPDIALVLVGKGRYRTHLERLVTQRSLEQHVFFAGAVNSADLASWFAIGDVFAMPCRTRRAGWDVEGLGIVYLEASSLELPVIAGNSGGAPDAVRNGETGFVVNGRQVEEVAQTIARVLNDRALSAQLGVNGRAWVEQAWTWDYEFSQLLALLP